MSRQVCARCLCPKSAWSSPASFQGSSERLLEKACFFKSDSTGLHMQNTPSLWLARKFKCRAKPPNGAECRWRVGLVVAPAHAFKGQNRKMINRSKSRKGVRMNAATRTATHPNFDRRAPVPQSQESRKLGRLKVWYRPRCPVCTSGPAPSSPRAPRPRLGSTALLNGGSKAIHCRGMSSFHANAKLSSQPLLQLEVGIESAEQNPLVDVS